MSQQETQLSTDVKKRRVVLIRHEHEPMVDHAYGYFVKNGFEVDIRRPFAGDNLDIPQDDLAGTVIYGGSFNVDETEKYPFLKDEYTWIAKCLKADVPMLGICQGAQQIAWHLGAHVGPVDGDATEFGYYKIRPTEAGKDIFPDELVVTQSHFHEFHIPEGAVCLAESDLFEYQAFRLGDKVYGFQFHAEQTMEGFHLWQEKYEAERKGRPGIQDRETQNRLMLEHDEAQAKWFNDFLGKLFVPAEV